MSRPRPRVPLLLRLSARLLPSDVQEEILGDLVEHWRTAVAGRGRAARVWWLTRQPFAAASARLRFRSGEGHPGEIPRGRAPALFSWLDVKLGARMMLKQPGLSLVIVFALALGIPVSLAPNHLVDAFFDESPPLADGREVVGLLTVEERPGDPNQLTASDWILLRGDVEGFEALGAAIRREMNVIALDGTSEGANGAYMSASSFDLARVPPLMGRTLSPEDEVEGAPDVAVIGYDFWRSRLGADPRVIGTTLRVGGVPTTVVGVMPERFEMPAHEQLWLPLRLSGAGYGDGLGPRVMVYGRLADGVSRGEAAAELRVLSARAATGPERETVRFEAVPFSSLTFDQPRGGVLSAMLIAVQGLPLLFLLVACGNVGILLLARTATRAGEVAIRAALGASRTRIVGQLFVEALLLALVATGVGLFAVDAVVRRLQPRLDLPFWVELGVTPELVGKALVLAVLSATIAGVLPALRATGAGLHRSLQGLGGGGGRTLRFGPLVTALVVAEVALGVGALFAGGLVLYAFRPNPDAATLGMEADRYLVASIAGPRPPLADAGGASAEAHRVRVASLEEELGQRLAAEAGVRGWAFSDHPPGGEDDERSVRMDGDGLPADHPGLVGVTTYVGPDFFRVLDVAPVAGRLFDGGDVPADPSAQPTAAVVNVKFLERRGIAPSGAIGRTMRFTDGPRGTAGPADGAAPWTEIVGVVPNLEVSASQVAFDGTPVVYLPATPGSVEPLTLIVDLASGPAAFASTLRALVAATDPTAIVESVAPMEELGSDGPMAMRILTAVMAGLSLIAILLSTAALYALMTLTVSQRTREIGIRVALGGEAPRIVATVARRALAQLALGVMLGAGFWIVFLSTFVEGSGSELDRTIELWPMVLLGASGVVVAVGLVACLAPTLRGVRTRPMEALQAEG